MIFQRINKMKNKKGFTLIELIVVIAIIGILAAIVVPRLSGFQDTAKQKADIATGKTIATAVATLMANGEIDNDTDIALPGSTDASDAVEGYLQSVPANIQGDDWFITTDGGDVVVYADNTDAAANRVFPTQGSGYGGTD